MLNFPFQRDRFAVGQANPLDQIIHRIRFRDCYRARGRIPAPDEAQRLAIDTLRRDGTVLLAGHLTQDMVKTLRSEFQQALEALEFEMPCLSQSKIDPVKHAPLIENFLLGTPASLAQQGVAFERSEASSLAQVVASFAPSTLTAYMLGRSDTYRQVWLDPFLLGIVANYLGMIPKLAEAYVRRNYPARFRTMNHYWHRDLNDRLKLLKAFIFLTDCEVTSGPHEFIKGSHAKFDVLNGKRYYTDVEVDSAHPVGSPHRLVSEVKAGTIIIEDTRGLHRARVPDAGLRDLGYAVYMPLPDSTRISYFDFPMDAFARLSDFQQQFIMKSSLR